MGPDKSPPSALQLGTTLVEARGRGYQLWASAGVRVDHLFSPKFTLPMDSIHCVVFIAGFTVAIGKNEALSSWVESIRDPIKKKINSLSGS